MIDIRYISVEDRSTNHHPMAKSQRLTRMNLSKPSGPVRCRTHYLDLPDKRMGDDRRKVNCFIEHDRRCGVACRRKQRQRIMEERMAARMVRFYPEYERLL